MNFKWAAWSPIAWHTSGLLLHAANTMLVFYFLKRYSASIWPAFGAALLFAWHASHVEAVCWTAASFDLLATFFCLLTLLLASAETAPIMLLITAALACLCKESAYCLPLLVACSGLLCNGIQRRKQLLKSLWVALVCANVFIYRIWYLQGIGGYRTGSGSPMVFHLQPLSMAQALLLRLWAMLFLPVNWSTKPEAWLSVAITLMLAALCFVRIPATKLPAALLFTMGAAIPVFPLLLIGFDLSGARVLYLPSVGIALLWSTLPLDKKTLAFLTFAASFQLAALLHNEFIWKHKSNLAYGVCLDAAHLLKQNPSLHIHAVNMPRVRNGVYFLGNGFAKCVSVAGNDAALNSRVSAQLSANDYILGWDNATAHLKASSEEPYPQK